MLRAFVLSVVVVSMGWAQEDRASISGQVTDPSGSAVPNAQVTVTSVERNTVSKAASTETGRYQVGFLLPGRYTLSVEAPGFKKYVRQNIQLQVAEKLGLDVPLEIGAPAESITITEQAGLLETESAGRGQVVTHKELTDIPNNGHVVMQLVWAVVGVTRTTNSWGSMGVSGVANATNFSINGGRPGENEVLLDGVSDVAGDRQVKHIPQIETVQEFKVSTNAFDAQYGRTGGGVISFTTKSGTNQLHGVAWEYHRTSSILTANVWAYNRLGIPLPKIHMNSFGFLADGRSICPSSSTGATSCSSCSATTAIATPASTARTSLCRSPSSTREIFRSCSTASGNWQSSTIPRAPGSTRARWCAIPSRATGFPATG